jgi:sRNA-binding protein
MIEFGIVSSRAESRIVLVTRRPAYWRACTAGAERIDLAPQFVGIVTEDEAAYAAERLAEYHSSRGYS